MPKKKSRNKKEKMSENKNNNKDLIKRLDALIRIIFEININKNREFNIGDLAQILKSVGLTPTEIAKILGKKSATDVAMYIYGKKGKNAKKRKK